jgi:uncharacterized Ntn-hydrolase superfamily protein
MRRIIPITVVLSIALPVVAVERPVHTYSIVARDAETGEMGVAVQSHWFSVGSIVTWAEAGVGAIATQSFVDPAYGPRGLELMKSGLSADQALKALLLVDGGRDVRQVAFIDSSGQVAAHTGAKCIESAGHHVGDGYSVQANMMLNDEVVPAMAKAYESARGDLANRLMAALTAAQSVGGDIRGRQSAAMLIVKAESHRPPRLRAHERRRRRGRARGSRARNDRVRQGRRALTRQRRGPVLGRGHARHQR